VLALHATDFDARAGILPNRNALSKRKLSKIIRSAPQQFTVFPQRRFAVDFAVNLCAKLQN
jgi:hypothetical protein